MSLPYDADALHALADRMLCCTKHHHAVPVDAEELVALLAEFRRMQPVLHAALMGGPDDVKAAVAVYWEARRAAGANGGPGPQTGAAR